MKLMQACQLARQAARAGARAHSDVAVAARPRRAFMFMPGNEMRKIQKAMAADVDTVCLCLEDGVSYNKKEEARHVVSTQALKQDFGRSEVCVRINSVGTGLEEADMRALCGSERLPDSIAIPKVDSAAHLEWADTLLRSERGAAADGIKFLVFIESAVGMAKISEIMDAVPDRIEALVFGGDDYAASTGAIRTRSNHELAFPRGYMLMHALSRGLQAIDIVNIRFKEPDQLIKESEEGFEMGYTGKQIIHPAQIEPVQAAFSPRPEKIAWAHRITTAFEEHERIGRGAFTYNDEMIDAPTVKQATNIVNRARECGLL